MSVEMLTGGDSVSVDQLAEWRVANSPHTVLDVREANELAICQIENVLHIPMSQVPSMLEDLPQDRPIVVMCHHGMRSMQVVRFLRNAGRQNAVNLDGGIDAWADRIDTSMRRY